MKITLKLDKGYLPDKYGKYADDQDCYKGVPTTSFPIQVSEIPEKAKTLALYLIDYDAIPVAGFPWIHWSVANIPVSSTDLEIPENFSQTAGPKILQGKNSQASRFVGVEDPLLACRYTGPTPPNADHRYSLHVAAFDDKLDLAAGFPMNELYFAFKNSLVEAELDFWSKA